MVYKRDILIKILPFLGTDNIIVLHGSRQVGKTHILYLLLEILKNKNEQTFFIDLEDSSMTEILDAGVSQFLNLLKDKGIDLKKKCYVFLDEIQLLENPSSFLKLIVDHEKQIQLIVSGSSSFEIKRKFRDSLAGRTVDFEIFPLNFFEFLRFRNEHINLKGLSSEYYLGKTIDLYKEYMNFGGYPKIVLTNSIEEKEKYLKQIVETYVKRDVRDLVEIASPKKFNGLLKILAEQSGQMLNVSNLSSLTGLSRPTIENYLLILENTFIIKLLPVWSKSTKVEVVKSPKIFFYDTGILQILRFREFNSAAIGNLFETSVFSEIIKKQGTDGAYFWRTKNQTEIDFILEKKGKLIPIEVKIKVKELKTGAISSFQKKYNAPNYKIITLSKKSKANKNIFYPWEI